MRMGQQMKLAPRMIQSMEILQMPQQALEERIDQELSSNPTLEQVEASDDQRKVQEQQNQADRDDHESEREMVVDGDNHQASDDFERLSNFSEQYGDVWNSNTAEGGATDFRRSANRGDGERDTKMDALANTAARGASLYDQLINQWHLVEIDAPTLALGEYLIGLIDQDGYLRTEPQKLLEQAPPGVTADQIDQCVELLQEALEPTGLAARDFRECLLLQIDRKLYFDPPAPPLDEGLKVARTLVQEHLNDIEGNRYPKIAKATDLDISTIQSAIRQLHQFHPHPGRLLARDEVHTITPDAVIEYNEDTDCYVTTLTHGRLPALQISAYYEGMAGNKTTDKKTKDFIGVNLRNAKWLMDAIRQRHATLLRVIGVVIEAQREFFEQGESALKPLPMTLVADQLGIHVATVSRAVNEKYLQTPRGIFPLRMFFSGGTETDAGDAMSWTAVQAKLKDVIDAENKKKPFSDDELVVELKKQGIEIARRTVAKYRKQLNLPPARQRREY